MQYEDIGRRENTVLEEYDRLAGRFGRPRATRNPVNAQLVPVGRRHRVLLRWVAVQIDQANLI